MGAQAACVLSELCLGVTFFTGAFTMRFTSIHVLGGCVVCSAAQVCIVHSAKQTAIQSNEEEEEYFQRFAARHHWLHVPVR